MALALGSTVAHRISGSTETLCAFTAVPQDCSHPTRPVSRPPQEPGPGTTRPTVEPAAKETTVPRAIGH